MITGFTSKNNNFANFITPHKNDSGTSFKLYGKEETNDSNDNTKSFSKYATPQSKKSKSRIGIDSEFMQTPLKKSMRRECTPVYSPKNGTFGSSINSRIFSFCQSDNNNNNFNDTSKCNLDNITESPFLHNKRESDKFDVISKEKFLENLNRISICDTANNSNSNDNNNSGTLLNIENNNSNFGQFFEQEKCRLYDIIVNDQDLLNRVTYIACNNFFNGFNSRNENFFKFLVK